jgi:hypothetical protein
MQLIFLVLLFCFFIFLFVLYYLAKDDFVIIRRDISLDRIFNVAFLTGIVSLFFARLFFVLLNPSKELFNPLVFLAFPYVPGLSILGGIAGGAIFTYLYARYRKMPAGKILDLFTMSFISVLPIGYLLTYLLLFLKVSLLYIVLFIASIFWFLLFNKLIHPFSLKGEIKDGSLSLIFISIFSFLYFISKLFINLKTFSFFDLENVFLLILIFLPLVLLINQEIMDKFLIKK